MSKEVKQTLDLESLQGLYKLLTDEYNRLLLLKSEIERTIDTLKALTRAESDEVGPLIIPVTGYLSLLVPEVKRGEVLFLMGSNIYARMTPERALEEAKSRLEEVDKALKEVGQSLASVQVQLEMAKRKGSAGAR